MPTPTADEFYAFRLNFERASATFFKSAAFAVVSPFLKAVPLMENGEIIRDATGAAVLAPDLQSVPPEHVIVRFEPGDTDPAIRAFSTRPEAEGWPGNKASETAGFAGTLVIMHRVPVSDAPTQPGEAPGCYEKLCQQEGRIRALMRETSPAFRTLKDSLPWYDITKIFEVQPDLRVDTARSANEGTMRFRIEFMPRGDGAVTGF